MMLMLVSAALGLCVRAAQRRPRPTCQVHSPSGTKSCRERALRCLPADRRAGELPSDSPTLRAWLIALRRAPGPAPSRRILPVRSLAAARRSPEAAQHHDEHHVDSLVVPGLLRPLQAEDARPLALKVRHHDGCDRGALGQSSSVDVLLHQESLLCTAAAERPIRERVHQVLACAVQSASPANNCSSPSPDRPLPLFPSPSLFPTYRPPARDAAPSRPSRHLHGRGPAQRADARHRPSSRRCDGSSRWAAGLARQVHRRQHLTQCRALQARGHGRPQRRRDHMQVPRRGGAARWPQLRSPLPRRCRNLRLTRPRSRASLARACSWPAPLVA